MKKLELCVLITTMNKNIKRVKEELLPQLTDCNVVISHQITKTDIHPETEPLGKNVFYTPIYNSGASTNRNNALKYAKGDICIFCDDDLNYIPNFKEIIIKGYMENPKADVITFRAIKPEGTFHDKLNKKFKHNFKTILSVITWMISFKNESVVSKDIKFDENFGFSRYLGCEENIFLKDCLDNNLNILHLPEPIVIHPEESTGNSWTEHVIYSKGAAFRRMYGNVCGALLCLIFCILKYGEYKKKLSFMKHLKLILKGFFDFRG
ncbi:glycosyltransferase involved in cell wall biosynthesis [Methanococcus maripaludis]|uniref:Glycosyltransferase involved in cell wall biosynthesis n=1 Tax=Methanococcus maripaludis TaxID=39152 RepID=A0A7J9NT93_METMI|nr:glycosyltransferase family 2 protein [Methanococcus maripaludis]MBA2850514.1 glycosyltransferase involved in cell wall biosynthesis [Methanococcus maripaludis]